MAPHKPLFFRFCFHDCAFLGYLYDPCFVQWYNFDFPRLEKSIWRTSSSGGLVCLMNTNDGDRLLVGNPIKRDWKLLPRVPGGSFPQFNALALSFDRLTRDYTVVSSSMDLVAPIAVLLVAAAVTLGTEASIHAYDLEPFREVRNALLLSGGSEGIVASRLDALGPLRIGDGRAYIK
ncbi:F-box/kelch-repeat protein At3g61590-like [Zingiber officinale]|uniref:F-box/kelch-repeat protein At3g61590-like n=1 Tax=Zingiber officinale TaxID=94328 RepID=UPI001C4DA61E|nr:F-box/kelch-repeat protein At3g61590-like [Zingiber officinale]